jgi:hypothetical protein
VRLLLALCLTACAAPSWKSVPHDRLYQRTPSPKLHLRPAKNKSTDLWYGLVHTTARPLGQALSPGYWIDRAAGAPEPLDINAFGQVLDSPWFFNRINRYRLSPEEVAKGPNRLEGPADGPLAVIGGKIEGATPGLIVRDPAGDVFVVKFDPPAYPELSSSAEAVSTKILYAAGYYVPENYVVALRLDRLQLAPNATTAGEYGVEVPLTQQRLDALITHINPFPDGTVRALFSRFIPGELLGPFDYRGVRRDDPNDIIPHEHRRSLRGLRMFAAWINNSDTRSSNTLDVFIPSEEHVGLGHVRHYLLDFGDSLGSAGVRPKYVGQGYQNRVDWAQIGASFFSAGIYYPYWLPVRRSPYRSVGVFEAQVFDPASWAPTIQNPAFDRADILDDYWAASIIARFTPDQLGAVVARASYSERGAGQWVLRVLTERQFKILDYAFSRILPLEDPTIESRTVLAMKDLAVFAGLNQAYERRYRYRVHREGVELATGTLEAPRVDLAKVIAAFSAGDDPFLTVTWSLADRESPSTDVHLRVLKDGLLPVAMTRHE